MGRLYDAFFEKALLAIKDRDYVQAEGLLTEAIKLKPDFAEAWVVRGNVRMAREAPFDAILHFDRALELNPKLHDAWNNRGIAFADIAMWASAEECYRRSADILPCIDPYMNLANMFCAMNRLSEAEVAYRKCLEFDPGNLDAHINLGLTLLGQGRWNDGWKHYEHRHANTPYQMRSRRLHQNWQGESLKGKTILLYPEQGLGDEIAFMRYATLVKAEGAATVILEAMPPLLRLARTVEGVDRVYVKNEAPEEGIDVACAIMDVPMVLGIEAPEEFAPRCYLHPPSIHGVPPLPRGINVGLCWQTGQRPLQPEARATAANKSLPLLWLKPLARPGVNLISLQLDNPEPRLSKELGLVDFMPGMSDLADTATLIEHLDLVVSVDTAVAHLAGALGRPVWNLVRHSGYWPWLDAVRDTGWYPSMRVYRQPRTFDWEPALDRLFVDFDEFVSQRMAA